MNKVYVCNTGKTGQKVHAICEGHEFALCGKWPAHPNKGDEELLLSDVTCKKCKIMWKRIIQKVRNERENH